MVKLFAAIISAFLFGTPLDHKRRKDGGGFALETLQNVI